MLMMMTMMMEKNRAGVNLMTLVFLASLYSALVLDVSGVSYMPLEVDPLNYKTLEKELINKINETKGQYFYVGVASAHGTTPIQSLCYRQGERYTQPYATRCTKPSAHHADKRAKGKYGAGLTTVFYSDHFYSKSKVCAIEKSLIAKYYRADPLFLNEKSGQDNCIETEDGIVYLRIYKPESTTQERVATKIDPPRPGKRTISMTEGDSQRRSKRIRKPVVLFQML